MTPADTAHGSIRRAPRPERDWFPVRNELARDERLSYRARGVLVAILSRPDDWRTDSAQLAREGKEGREAVRAALRELENAGYLRRRKVRGEKGRFYLETIIYDVPQPLDGGPETLPSTHPETHLFGDAVRDISAGHTSDGFPGAGGPGAGGPGAGSPGAGFLGAIQKTETKNREVGSASPRLAPRRAQRSAPRGRPGGITRRRRDDLALFHEVYADRGQDADRVYWAIYDTGIEHPGAFARSRDELGEFDGYLGARIDAPPALDGQDSSAAAETPVAGVGGLQRTPDAGDGGNEQTIAMHVASWMAGVVDSRVGPAA